MPTPTASETSSTNITKAQFIAALIGYLTDSNIMLPSNLSTINITILVDTPGLQSAIDTTNVLSISWPD